MTWLSAKLSTSVLTVSAPAAVRLPLTLMRVPKSRSELALAMSAATKPPPFDEAWLTTSLSRSACTVRLPSASTVASPMVMVEVLLPAACAPAIPIWMPPPPAPLAVALEPMRLLVSMMTVLPLRLALSATVRLVVTVDVEIAVEFCTLTPPPEAPVDDALTVPSPPAGLAKPRAPPIPSNLPLRLLVMSNSSFCPDAGPPSPKSMPSMANLWVPPLVAPSAKSSAVPPDVRASLNVLGFPIVSRT